MKLGRLTFTLALAGIAANMFLKKRAASAPPHPDFVDTEDSGYAGGEATLEADAPSEMSGATGVPETALDAVNPAERMQSERSSTLAEAIDRTSDDLFESNSQGGPYARTPGLPDLTRGA
jgi:hypothetical protein